MGAKIGWAVSGLIIFLIIFVVWIWMAMGNGLEDPTAATTTLGRLSKINVDTDFSALTTIPEGGGDAQTDYAAAVTEMMKNNPSHFLNMVKKSSDTATEFKSIFDKLEQAADKGISNDPLTFSAMPINPATTFAAWDGLVGIGEVAGKAAMEFRYNKKQAEAERALRAELTFGVRLWKLAPYVQYKSAGMALISDALAQYKSHYTVFPNAAKLSIATQHAAELLPISHTWSEKEQYTIRVNPREMHTGDLANLADNDQDRAWRIEGVVMLGYAKWAACGSKMRGRIDSYLAKKENDSDPLLAQAAKEALAFTKTDAENVPTVPVE